MLIYLLRLFEVLIRLFHLRNEVFEAELLLSVSASLCMNDPQESVLYDSHDETSAGIGLLGTSRWAASTTC